MKIENFQLHVDVDIMTFYSFERKIELAEVRGNVAFNELWGMTGTVKGVPWKLVKDV